MDMVVGDNLTREEMRDIIGRLFAEVAERRQEMKRLRTENERLKGELYQTRCELDLTRRKLAAALKNSSNSSKPPSSDIVKPSDTGKNRKKTKRRPGGQPGHPKHERPMLKPDVTYVYKLDACPDCGGHLQHVPDAERVVQQVELVAAPVQVEEHHGEAYFCRRCNKVHRALLPPEVGNGGLLGPHLMGLVAYLKGACHMSFSTIRRYFRDVLKTPLSRGFLAKVIRQVSEMLKSSYDGLCQLLPQQDALHIDETGHPHPGKPRHWTWCLRAKDFVVFKIADSRGSKILWEMVGSQFPGVIGCDYFSAYRKFMKDCDVRVQFCLAHLIRDLKYMTTLPDRATTIYAENLLLAMRDLFRIIHRRGTMSETAFVRALRDLRDAILAIATHDVPNTREARNLAKRFRKHGAAYFEFITTPAISPTNNLAEQAIRFVVIDRHITQGTRSQVGIAWCERIWTVLATCAQQCRSTFEFLLMTIQAVFSGKPPPMLVLNTS